LAAEPQDNAWRALAVNGHLYRFCANAELDSRSWKEHDVAARLFPKASPSEALALVPRRETFDGRLSLHTVELARGSRSKAAVAKPAASAAIEHGERGAGLEGGFGR
jgi:hypothetical protein